MAIENKEKCGKIQGSRRLHDILHFWSVWADIRRILNAFPGQTRRRKRAAYWVGVPCATQVLIIPLVHSNWAISRPYLVAAPRKGYPQNRVIYTTRTTPHARECVQRLRRDTCPTSGAGLYHPTRRNEGAFRSKKACFVADIYYM